VNVSAPPAAPTATLTPAASTIVVGSATTLTWSSTNATGCTASGAWSGAKPPSGTETVTPAALGASSYTLSCTGAGGSVAASAAVTAINSVDFLLTANEDGNVSAYKLNASTGAPTDVAGSPFLANGSVRWVVFSGDNRFAYAASNASIFSYGVDQVTGALTALPGSPFPTGSTQGMAIHPSGNWIYVADGDSGLLTFAVNPTTGALTNVGTLAFKSFSFTLHPSGNLAYVTGHPSSSPGIFAFSIDGNGVLASIPGGPVANVVGSRTMGIDPSGKFAYAPNQIGTSVSAFTINTTTGALSPIVGSPYTTLFGPSSIAFDPQGAFVYVACWGGPSNSGGLHAFAINSSSGALNQIVGSPYHTAYSWAIAMNRSGKILYEMQVNSTSELRTYTVGATGGLTENPGMRLPRSGVGIGMALSR
jgi:6-phosphogluconolactonase (cycloisomerase 2 family)